MTRDQLARLLASVPQGTAVGFSDDGPPEAAEASPARVLTPAAVLIAVINREDGPAVVFTQRTAHLNHHAGQISFPGGRVDPGDADAASTALREAEEETGLPSTQVNLLGRIPDYRTGTGFLIAPIVGWVEPPVVFQPDPFEVAEVFEVPLAYLLEPSHHLVETALFRGRLRTYFALTWEGRYIWGATAGMLVNFYRVLAQANGQAMVEPTRRPVDSG